MPVFKMEFSYGPKKLYPLKQNPGLFYSLIYVPFHFLPAIHYVAVLLLCISNSSFYSSHSLYIMYSCSLFRNFGISHFHIQEYWFHNLICLLPSLS
jgi:hypothetical protein